MKIGNEDEAQEADVEEALFRVDRPERRTRRLQEEQRWRKERLEEQADRLREEREE